jgi:glycosyltransferase involved in cell wall biosynthesis
MNNKNNNHRRKRVAIIQRVIFHYRMGFFSEAAKCWDTRFFHGESVFGSKVVNAKGQYGFSHHKLFTVSKRAKNNPQQILYFNPGLVVALMRWNPDVIVLEGSNNMLNNIFVYIYCTLSKKKMIWWGIGQVPGRKESIYRKILTPFRKIIIKRADSILAYCSLSEKYFKTISSKRGQIKVMPNSLDNRQIQAEISKISTEDKIKLRKELNLADDKVILLFVGAIEFNKNLDILISATKELSQKGRNVETIIIGSGPAVDYYRSYAKQLQINNCQFLGKIIEGVNIYFQLSDIFVLPGRGGLAINQALINGLPVVCNSPADGTEQDMIRNGYNGYLLNTMNTEQLTCCLEKMITSNNYVEMGSRSKKIIEKEYNIGKMIKVLTEAIG